MKDVHYNSTKLCSYGGVRPLVRYSANWLSAKNWLATQDACILHKPVREIFARRKTHAKGIHDLFQADLADLQHLSRNNDGYRFILTCIYVFSQRAFTIPLKDKSDTSAADAFEKIFAEATPVVIQTDRGTEFLAGPVQDVFRKHDIKHYWSLNDYIKAAGVECFNRTLKMRMFRYLTHFLTTRWINVLNGLVASYNGTFHRSIGMSPNDVTPEKAELITKRLYPEKPRSKWKFVIGDTVGISKYKHISEKGYSQNWTDELFKITERHPTYPVTYGLTDLVGESIK
jgi:hypothetical protein